MVQHVEYQFSDPEPSRMASAIYDLAGYLIDIGDLVSDGDTIAARGGEPTWTARRAQSSVEPERAILALTA